MRFTGRKLTYDEGRELAEFLATRAHTDLLTFPEEVALGERLRDFKNDFSTALAKRWLPVVKHTNKRMNQDTLATLFKVGSKELADLLQPELLKVSGTATEAARLGYAIINGGSEYMLRYTPELTRENIAILTGAKGSTGLARQAVSTRAAMQELAERNVLLAVNVTKKALKQGSNFMDLLQDSMIGMMHAVEKYEVERGFKFSTYATWWLKQAIQRPSMTDLHHIHIPVHIVSKIPNYTKVTTRLYGKLGREPEPAEIIQNLVEHPIMTGKKKDKPFVLDENEILSIQAALRINLRANIRVGSTDGPDSDDRGDFYEDANQCPADALTVFDDRREQIELLLKGLTHREREVIKLRYGLGEDRQTYTLKEIGEDKLKLTRERVRQIEARGLSKLQTRVKGNALLAAKLRELLTENVRDHLS